MEYVVTRITELLNTLNALSAADPDHYPAVTLEGYFIGLYNKKTSAYADVFISIKEFTQAS